MTALFNFDKIPGIWKKAYLYLCLWYFLNYSVSAILEYQLERPFSFVFWNALYLFEALCILIAGILLYSHWLFRFNLYVQIAGHAAGAIVFFLLMGSLSYYLEDYVEGFVYFDQWKDHMASLLRWEGLHFQNQYLITAAVYYIIRYFQRMQKREQEKAELALKNREMQLSLLKSQINPHFLFNTLNSINTLISSNKESARKVITQLSDIFRYALDAHSDQPVKLIHELDFIDNYIKIQQVRFGSRLKFVKQVDFTCLGIKVPPMILQPLVENAVKYGIAPKEEGGTITLTVKRFNKMIFFEVKDDGLGSKAKKVMDASSSGVGLKNTDSRLRNTFGPDAGLRIHASEWGYSVSFFIPLSEEEQQPHHEPELHKEAV
ncbi:MAG: histidine kinase [Cyclobacteriaceae bacterium]|nr:histidine kinase [Cyclobacteriaceae bacterium]MCX7636658.1 histidine kinase [Cyclobacteriaceae bacterium]MDW8330943.1 histidine kinase [Cyclobacteriaceae bacterium]